MKQQKTPKDGPVKLRQILAPLLIGAAAAAIFLLLTACQPMSFNVHANGTVAPANANTSTMRPTAPPATTDHTAPPADNGVSPSASIPGLSTPAQVITSVQVENCLTPVTGNPLDPQTMILLASQQTWGNLTGCLQIPAVESGQFTAYITRLVLTSARNGDFRTVQSCRDWEDNSLTPQVNAWADGIPGT